MLDAFAGTGAVGLEALSRGAASAVFIEKDRIAQKILASNIATLGAASHARLVKTSVSKWCETMMVQNFHLFLQTHHTMILRVRVLPASVRYLRMTG